MSPIDDLVTPPIFAIEGYDLNAFANVATACAYMEAIDVENGEYRVLDARGLVLMPCVEDGRVVVSVGAFTDTGLLRDMLRLHLRAVIGANSGRRRPRPITVDPEHASLQALVEAVVDIQRLDLPRS